MDQTRRRGYAYVGLIVGVLVFYTIAYKYGMTTFEGRPRSFIEALQVVVQAFTTTGFGEDAPWRSPQMLILIVLMQFTGVFLLFLTLPLFVVPWIERRLEATPSTSFDGEDHVVICGFSKRGDALVEELRSQDVEYVVLVEDRDRWRSLSEEGYSVVLGDPETTDALSKVAVSQASAVVLDHGDEANAHIGLSVRQVSESVRMVGFLEDPALESYLELAGVDEVLLPRELLGQRLADKVTSAITTKLGETIDIGADIEIIELPLQGGCGLEDTSLRESGIREETGANVIGVWVEGEFVADPGPETVLGGNSVLLVSGTEEQLQAVMEMTMAPGRSTTRDVVIGGYGDVGKSVKTSLQASHISCTVLDLEAEDEVDVVGDATSESVLREAGIKDAGAFIVSIGDDTHAVFATLVAREANPNLDIIARANETENISKLYAAGADYVLALSRVSGRMLAESILDEDVISYDTQIDIVRTKAPSFEGQTLQEANIRARTGCTVIAAERNGEVHSSPGVEFEIRSGDSLVVAGTDQNIARFQDLARTGAGRE